MHIVPKLTGQNIMREVSKIDYLATSSYFMKSLFK